MAEFEKEIHEESSLTLKERAEEFLEGLSLKWQEFLDWSDEKGLPLRRANNFFEEKGIPALPAMLVILLLLIGGAYVAFLSVSAPVVKNYSITVRDSENNPVSGASVQLQFSTPEGLQTKTDSTDASGKVSFASIPSDKATVVVHAADYEPQTRQAVVDSGRDAKALTVSLTRIDNPNVVLSVTIAGPSAADVVLLAANNSVLDSRNATTLVEFEVLPNSNYTIIAKSTGYRDELKVVEIGTANFNVPLHMFREGEERTAPIYARVYQLDGSTPIPNATMSVLDEITGAVIASGETGGDGASTGIDVAVGRNVSISISRDGFLTWFLPTLSVKEPTNDVVAKLTLRTEENSKNIVIRVIDDNGQGIEEPHVVLYCDGSADSSEVATPDILQKEPRDGIAGFDVAIGVSCLASVSKDGFLPVQKELTSVVEQSIVLHRASSANSGSVIVETLDPQGNSLAGVDVALFIGGKPLGIIGQTGIDGTAEFDFLPLTDIAIIASTTGFEGNASLNVESVDATGVAGKEVSISMSAAKALVQFNVVDHFSRLPVLNAVVTVKPTTSGSAASCNAVNGSCAASVENGEVTVSVTGPGFEQLETEFTVLPGSNLQELELISIELADDAALTFLGVFNEQGQRVSVLSPATRYTAKYLMKAPSLEFSGAKAFVQIGERDVGVESGSAVITSFSAPGAKMVGGVDYSSADSFEGQSSGSLQLVQEDFQQVTPTQVLPNGDLTALQSTSGTSASITSGKFKWVEFTFDNFEGSHELKVQFETNVVESANVELFHRTAYDIVLANGSSEVLASPEDSEAGASTSPLFAALSEPDVVPIHFEGKCVEGTCVELWFEGLSGRSSAFEKFEAVVPEVFKLNYRAFSNSPAAVPITASLQSDNDAVQIGNGNDSAVQRGAEGFFAITSLRFSNDVPLSFSLAGSASFESDLHVSISNAGNELAVNFNPATLNAFEENAVTFRITDKYGAVVPGGRLVFVKGPALAASVEANEEENGRFTAQLTPSSFGEISYKVEALGFRSKAGKLNVVAKNLVSIEPLTGLAVAADSFDQSEGSSFTITNLAPDKQVKVTLSATADSSPKYSAVSLSSGSLTLKGGESKTVSLIARIRDDVLPFALNPSQLKENYNGKIRVTAKVGSFSKSTQLPFSASATLQQQKLSDLLDYSTDSLDFAIDLPRKRSDTGTVEVTNNAAKPVIVNQQSLLPGVHVSPASAIIPPDGSVSFNVSASPSFDLLQQQCVFEDLSERGAVQFIASFQGITSSKTIDVNLQTTSHTRCVVPGALTVILPFDINFIFPPGTIASKTPAFDGSQAVKLPSQELVVFSTGAQVADLRAYLPAGTPIEIGAQHVQQDGPDAFQVRFPFHAVIAVPPGSQQNSLPDGSVKLSTPASEITLPPGLQLAFQGGTPSNSFASSSDQYNGFRTPLEYQRFGSFFGTRSSYNLPAFTPIRITATRQSTGEPFEISYEDEVYVDLPADAQVSQTGNTVNALMLTCYQLTVYSKGSSGNVKQVRDVLPSGKQVSINGALSGRTVKVTPGGKITLQTCLGIEEENKLFQTKLRSAVTFVLPPGTPDPRPSLEVNFPSCAELVYKSGYSLGVQRVKKIIFAQGTKVKEQLENGGREIEVDPDATVQFAPCRSTTPGVSSFSGLGLEARASKNSGLVFTFTEGDISGKRVTADQTICLVNHRKNILSPANGNFLIGVEGGQGNEAAFELATVKPYADAALAPSQNAACNNEFKLTAQIPASVYENGCISKPGEYDVVLKFAARDSTGWQSGASLPVKIVVRSSKECKTEQLRQTSVLLRSFFVDYANTNKNERTGAPFVFAFKGTGENHARVLTLLNNLEEPVSISHSGASAISCNFPASIPASGAVSVKCVPRSPTVDVEKLTITAAGAGTSHERVVNVQVYDGKKEIYNNTPWGELAAVPSSTSRLAASQIYSFEDAAGGVGSTRVVSQDASGTGAISLCSRHYCTFEQARGAFNEFVGELAAFVDQEVATKEAQEAFCAPGASAGKAFKSTIIHMANTNNDLASYIASPAFSSSVPYNVESVPSLKGCGVFRITGKIDVCSRTGLGTVEERRRNSRITITSGEKLAECTRNLANSPLFLGGREENLNVYTGRELGLTVHKPKSISDVFGIVSLGPYASNEDEADNHTATLLLQAIYGEPIPEVENQAATNYDSPSFCFRKGGKQMLKIVGAGAVLAAGLAATGGGAAVAAKILYGVGQTLVFCGISAAGEVIASAAPGEQPLTCPIMNDCIRSAVFGAISGGLAPAGAGFRASLPSVKGAIGYTALTAGATTVANVYNSHNGETPVTTPSQAGPTAYAGAKTLYDGRNRQEAAFIEEQFERVSKINPEVEKAFGGDGGKEMFARLIRENKKSGTAALSSTFEEPVKKMSFEAKLALQSELNAISGSQAALRASAVTTQLASKLLKGRPDLWTQIYDKVLTAKNEKEAVKRVEEFIKYRFGQASSPVTVKAPVKVADVAAAVQAAEAAEANALIAEQEAEAALRNLEAAAEADKATLRAAAVDKVKAANGAKTAAEAARAKAVELAKPPVPLKEVEEAFLKEAGEETGKAFKSAPKTGAFAKGLGFTKKVIGPALLQIAAQLALDVDVRPTEASLPASAKNALVVYHIESTLAAPTLPTIHKVCVEDQTGSCAKDIYLANACNSDTDACMLTYDLPNRGSESFGLIVAVNNKQIDENKLFRSIMVPEEPPLDLQGNFKFASLSPSDVQGLAIDVDDQGDETALKAAVKKKKK